MRAFFWILGVVLTIATILVLFAIFSGSGDKKKKKGLGVLKKAYYLSNEVPENAQEFRFVGLNSGGTATVFPMNENQSFARAVLGGAKVGIWNGHLRGEVVLNDTISIRMEPGKPPVVRPEVMVEKISISIDSGQQDAIDNGKISLPSYFFYDD